MRIRQTSVPAIVVLVEKGPFGECSCGGEVVFFSDRGVKCGTCSKLYGVWYSKLNRRTPEDLPENRETLKAQPDPEDGFGDL